MKIHTKVLAVRIKDGARRLDPGVVMVRSWSRTSPESVLVEFEDGERVRYTGDAIRTQLMLRDSAEKSGGDAA